MSVEQRVRISCDDFDCSATITSGVGLTAARTMTSQAGWVNTVHYIGPDYRVVLQDFCPEHRERGFDWNTWWKRERERDASHEAGTEDAHHD